MNEMGVMGGGGSGRFETPEEFKHRKGLWATPERGTDGGSARGLSARKLRSKMSHTFRIPYFECSECGEEFELDDVDLYEDEDGYRLVECPECNELLYLAEDGDEEDEEDEEKMKKGKVTQSMKAKIARFIKENPNPTDDDFHDLADELGIHPSQAEEVVYAMAHKLMKNEDKEKEGDEEEPEEFTWKDLKAGQVPDDKFDKKELKMGIKVEKEHTDDDETAKAIAKAHLMEIPDYYTRLKKMEKGAGVEENIARELVDLLMEGIRPSDLLDIIEEEL